MSLRIEVVHICDSSISLHLLVFMLMLIEPIVHKTIMQCSIVSTDYKVFQLTNKEFTAIESNDVPP